MIDGGIKIAAHRPTKSPPVTLDYRRIPPAEACAIANSPSGYIRWLRGLGLIKQSGGQATFDAFEIAHLAAMRLIAYRTGPEKAQAAAQMAAVGIVHHMMRDVRFYAGDHRDILKWDQNSAAIIEASDAASALISAPHTTDDEAVEEVRRVGVKDVVRGWQLQADWLKKNVFHKRTPVLPENARYLFWWSDLSVSCAEKLDDSLFDDRLGLPTTSADVLIIDFWAVATVLLERAAGRPFLNVHIANRKFK